MKKTSIKSGKGLFNLSPKTVVISIAICLGLLLFFNRSIEKFLADTFEPNISFQDRELRGKQESEGANKQIRAAIFDGEVYRTEERLREASAVAIAASITVVAAFMERHPLKDVNELINNMMGRGLLPPDLEFSKERNVLLSKHSTIHIRFRPSPFAVEIVSLASTRLDGPALMLRVPEEKQTANTDSRYFYSLTLDDVKVPEPFSTPSKILSYGWQSAIFKPELPEGVNLQKLNDWINGQK